ncbi:RPM1-interacting protein 4-like [Pistacia vera]|uniref:RPM1-interacting protein 4-like n=2 Tax=Pistacia vera TaxID=55513 RepID=UPI001262D0D0|nr:RPM1-interacting protein 4-like [Pistacia vera]
MAQRSQVPKFGNWENADNVPYTAYFEKARSNRSVKKNSNNTRGNLDMSSDNLSPVQAPPFQMEIKSGSQKGQEALRKKHVQSSSREDGDLRRPSESLLHHDPANRKDASGLPLHRDGSVSSNDSPKKATRQNVGSDHRIEHLALAKNHQARVGGKGSGISSPLWPRKSSTEGSNNLAPLNPGRSQMRSVTRGNDTPNHSAAVPKFGDWDESNPASADGFTHAFDKVRKEKLNGNGMEPVAATQNSSSRVRKRHDNKTPKRCWCFPWSK